MAIDKRSRLGDGTGSNPFDFRITQSGQVHILRGGRIVCVVGGKDAEKLTAKLERASAEQVQLLLAKASGHYKH